MKKSTLVMILCLVLAVALGVGGTLAYLTDTDADKNVMTVGRVSVVQNEQQRVEENGEFTDELEPFVNDKMLLPVTDRNGTIDNVTIGDHELELKDNYNNYIDKIVTATNTSNVDVYLRTFVALPTGIHEESNHWHEYDAAADVWLHWNLVTDVYTHYDLEEVTGDFYITVDGVEYEVWQFTHKAPVAPKETTYPVIRGLFMDKRVDMDEEGYYITLDDGTVHRIGNFLDKDGKMNVLVLTQAVQADGFDSADSALTQAFPYGEDNANVEKWFTGWTEDDIGSPGDKNDTNNPPVFAEVTVKDSAELANAIADGYDVIGLSAGEFTMPKEAKGKTLTFIGAGADKTTITVVPAGQGEAGGQLDYNLDGSTVEFNDLTIKTNSKTYAGYARLSGTYNNCTIQNTYNLGVGNSEFNDCTFNITNEYLRVGGAYNAAFNNCTFNTDGRALLVYQDGTTNDQTVTVKDCTFNATAAAKTWNGIHVSAVSIDGSQGGTYVVKLEGNNVVDSDFNGLWQIKAGAENVTVNE